MLWRVTSRKKEQESPRVGVLSRISWLFARGSVHLSVKLCSSGQRAVAKPRPRGKIQVWRYLKLSLAALCSVFSGQPGFLAEGATGGAFPWNRATFTVSLTYQIYIQIIYMICIWYVYCTLYIIYLFNVTVFGCSKRGRARRSNATPKTHRINRRAIRFFSSVTPFQLQSYWCCQCRGIAICIIVSMTFIFSFSYIL